MEDIRSALVNNEHNEKINKRGADSSPNDQDGQGSVYIKFCGHWLHRHPMNARLSFHGWAQFQWITECTYGSAISLSSSWEEAHELSILIARNYFEGWPNRKFGYANEMSYMGFLQSTTYPDGKQDSGTFAGDMFCSVERQMNGCFSAKVCGEFRNWTIAHMSRNDHRVRRFLSMFFALRSRLLIWVNDSKTGKVLYKPPEDQNWRVRRRHECKRTQVQCESWQTICSFDEAWLKEARAGKNHELMFSDHLEVIVWDNQAGQDYMDLSSNIVFLLQKAWFYPDYLSHMDQAVDLTCRLATQQHRENEEKIRHDGNLILGEIKKIRELQDSELKEHRIKDTIWCYNKMDEYLDRKYTPWGKPNCRENLNGYSIASKSGELTEDIKRKFERKNDDFWATFSKNKIGPESISEGETATTVDIQKLNPYRRPTEMPDSVKRYWESLRVSVEKCNRQPQYYDMLYPDQYHFYYAMDRIMVLWMQKSIEPSFHNGAVPNHHCFTANEKINNPLGLYCVYGDPNMTIPEIPPPNFSKCQMQAWERKNHGSWYSLCKFKSEPEFWPLEIDEADITNSIIANVVPFQTCFIIDDPHFKSIWEWKKLPKDYPLAKNLIHEKMEALFMKTAKLKDPSIHDYCNLRVDCWLVVGGSEEEIKNRTARMAEVFRNRSNGFKVKIGRNRSYLHVRADILMELEDNEWI
ncbi:Similar to conserved hypothetical protein [Ajellomyces dermatitidis SLH14081]; acc. no. XP_002620839 [Pyronema omphalodes CBS 100304]|uniref:Uncharacterized protein n=1 Tax=Pyronema omphalodes (strain CBS 100304) TaxID=1076935 RepID=U4KTT9_PYROM|nr:Similar to conserved hypothetical protein [Ajellomyces dermatitidis SLH14081]; acc. no. XP_002620839 [Pyronema omphalodes CBS 100304]